MKNLTLLQNRVMAIFKNHLVNYPTSTTLYYVLGVGSLLGIFLILQIITGVLLAMHYVPSITDAFSSVERIMREVSFG